MTNFVFVRGGVNKYLSLVRGVTIFVFVRGYGG